MLEALEHSHSISFLRKKLHWKNKFDSCPYSPKPPDDPKLNLSSFQEGSIPTSELLCFHGVSSEALGHIRILD